MALSDASPAPVSQPTEMPAAMPSVKSAITPKSGREHQWLVKLLDHEELALSLIRPFDVRAVQPVATLVRTPMQRTIAGYLRCAISSANQTSALHGMSREAQYLVLDKTSGAFLGFFAFTDSQQTPTLVDWVGGPFDNDGSKRIAQMFQLKRCLPLYEFGDLTGGKLLALIAASAEILRTWELRYSYRLAAMYVTTLHGKSSQYNRLHARGLQYLGAFPTGAAGALAGYYVQEFAPNARPFLAGHDDALGPRQNVWTFEEQVTYWRERWLPNRLSKVPDGWVRPDPETYRLSRLIHERRERPAAITE